MMNLKPNLWTLLFVILLGLWGYTQLGTQNESTPGGDPPLVSGNNTDKDSSLVRILTPYEIKHKRFNDNRLKYLNELKPCYEACSQTLYSSPDFFKIDWDELDALHKLDKSDYLYIIPMIESYHEKPDTNSACFTGITLAFTKVRPGATTTDFAKEDHVYNFATPCPPLCSDELTPYEMVCRD